MDNDRRTEALPRSKHLEDLPLDQRLALTRTLSEAYLEIFPSGEIERRLESFPPGSYLAITCSPSRGIEATLDLAERLSKKSLHLVPHVSARMVSDEVHLKEILARLAELNVDSVFVPAGDNQTPVGRFDSSLELLRAMAEIGHRIDDVGVAAYPEGHPFLDDATLLEALTEKQQLATYMVTQMCMNADSIAQWLKRVRDAGIHLPAWIGLPGVVDRAKLVSTALRIGVGESVRLLSSQKTLAGQLLKRKHYRPDDLLLGLAEHLHDPLSNIPGFHLYSFNQVKRTEAWRAEMVENLRRTP